MKKKVKISVVIPAHNEESNVERMIRSLIKNFKNYIYEIVVVDDCSTDNTGKIIDALSHKFPVVPVHRKRNGGVGNAIRKGLSSVSSKTDYVLLLDCDFLENMKDIRKMINNLSTADGFLGSRYIKGGTLVNYPGTKKIANRSFHLLARLFLGIPYIDVTNNFKLYKKEIIKDILPLLNSSGFSINAETGLYPILFGYSLKEIPVSWIGRTEDMGVSHFKVLKAGPGYVKVLLSALKLKYFEATDVKKRRLLNIEQQHFDNLVQKTGETYYGNLRPVADIRFKRKSAAILQLLKSDKSRILEIGCGTGMLSLYLGKKNPRLNIEAIDLSPKAIEVAKKQLGKQHNIKFRVGDVNNLPFKDATFDVVVGNSILHHVDFDKVVKEVKRVLKPNGIIWFSEPNSLNPQIAIEKNVPGIKHLLQDSPNERSFVRWQLTEDLIKMNFKNVKVQPYEFLHPLIPRDFMDPIVQVCIFLEKVPVIREFAGTLQISAEKG